MTTFTRTLTREEFVASKSGQWALTGAQYKKIRKELGFSAATVARGISVSESTLRRFEKGIPVTAARIIENAYKLFLHLHKAKEAGYNEFVHAPGLELLGVGLFIDYGLGDDTSVSVTRIEDDFELARFNTGNFEDNCALAEKLCAELGRPYAYLY
ncbi:DNA-binding transcriptional regulator [Paenibacillus sp. VMFN-D1]|uniref:helix-turn-helix domain-containing protein n=1 Tax=Paenibacillus sp. VMFN-D1 TaxID=2135608 RepID=UPI000E26D869|nr:helix-turn-helix transcriptional regulator [Paenibacillus sp. VMFN-D1]RED32414.1 hypothetical protein C7820_5694 [Paenibacillus sp. VMFN-D1]